MGQSPPSDRYNSVGNGVPLIQGRADIERNRTKERIWTTFVTKRCDAGDLILTVRAPVGAVAVAREDSCLGRGVCGLKPKGDSEFLYHALLFAKGRWDRIEQGSTFTAADTTHVRSFRILVPTCGHQQRKVAEVLSDADRLLDSLDALIAKKRSIRTATMQLLLRGEIRLPSFSGEWAEVQLREIARIVSGGTPDTQNASYWNGGVPWCVPTDITKNPGKYLQSTARTITELGLSSSGTNLLPAGALLLCSRATVGEVCIAPTPICTNQGFKSLVCRDGVLNEFLYYLVLTLRPRLIERASGSTFLEISKNAVGSIEVRLPAIEEQREIASALSGMDLEIEVLEERRDKTRAVKQGMMQQLLTGRITLIETPATRGGATAT